MDANKSENRFEIDVMVDGKTLSKFLLRNNYRGMSGLTGILISVAALVGVILFWNNLIIAPKILLFGLIGLFLVVQPITLIIKGQAQLKTEAFKKPFHYEFGEDKMTVTNVVGTVDVEWKNVRKVVADKAALYNYMNAVSAFILPATECDGKFDEIVEFVREKTKDN